MNLRFKFVAALTACLLTVAAAAAAVVVTLWSRLDEERQALLASGFDESIGVLVFLSGLLAAILALGLHALFRNYVLEPQRMSGEVRLMLDVNAGHRMSCTGPSEFVELANAINALADSREALQRSVEHRISEAGGALELENSRLATVMSQLSECVVVCNTAGAILLYNHRARWLLEAAPSGDAGQHDNEVVGLGRSLFAMLGHEVVAHGQDHIRRRLQEGDRDPVSMFVARTRNGRLLRARMAPVMVPATAGGTAELWGYVLVLENIGREMEMAGLREQLLTSLVESARASLASIRAAAENLLAHPQVDVEQRHRFLRIIAAEAGKLGDRLARVTSDQPGKEWNLPALSGRELLLALQREFESKVGIKVTLGGSDEPPWVRADSFLLAQALAAFATHLRDQCGVHTLALRLQREGAQSRLDIMWSGTLPDTDTALAWLNEPLAQSRYPEPSSLSAVVEQHGGEAWYTPDANSGAAYLRVLLAAADQDSGQGDAAGVPSRPIFYDFDLFHQPGQTPELDERPLADLAYTVFDTETTGLEPSRGDAIISIGAVRIVNGRLLAGEAFDQLVNPSRSLPPASVRIHGITSTMLEDQLPIERVLPAFHRFCADTVLVAHNAAFDMRFLQLNEPRTGVRFANPVLDTLLLSVVLHPDQPDHSLEALATRYGVSITGRHTALGDAIATGGIFVRMMPLLRAKGIVTLRQAREAAQRTPYAQVKY